MSGFLIFIKLIADLTISSAAGGYFESFAVGMVVFFAIYALDLIGLTYQGIDGILNFFISLLASLSVYILLSNTIIFQIAFIKGDRQETLSTLIIISIVAFIIFFMVRVKLSSDAKKIRNEN